MYVRPICVPPKKVDKLNPEAPDFQPKTASRLEKNTAWMMTNANAELRRENVELRGSLDDLEKRMKRLMVRSPEICFLLQLIF